jgi:hypothetical protein
MLYDCCAADILNLSAPAPGVRTYDYFGKSSGHNKQGAKYETFD